jgi:hypothetical protein
MYHPAQSKEDGMTKDEIPEFIAEVVSIGCDPVALVNYDDWFIGDADLPEPMRQKIQKPLKKICDRYGPRDHLHDEFVAHLRSIGRVPDFQKH